MCMSHLLAEHTLLASGGCMSSVLAVDAITISGTESVCVCWGGGGGGGSVHNKTATDSYMYQ